MLKTKSLRQLLAFVLLLLALPAWASPTFVNSAQQPGGTTGTNGSGSMTLTAGNTLVVFAAFFNGQGNNPHLCTAADSTSPCNGTNDGVTDSQGSTYTQLGVIQPNNATCNGTGGTTHCVYLEVWATTNIASSCSGTSCKVTVLNTPTGSGTGPALSFLQYSGVSAINLPNFTTGSGTSATSGTLTITTSFAEDVIVGGFADNPVNTMSVNGCTARGTATNNGAGTVNIKVCDSGAVTNSGTATSVGMTFASATWAGAAVELCSSAPCPAAGTTHNVVIIN